MVNAYQDPYTKLIFAAALFQYFIFGLIYLYDSINMLIEETKSDQGGEAPELLYDDEERDAPSVKSSGSDDEQSHKATVESVKASPRSELSSEVISDE